MSPRHHGADASPRVRARFVTIYSTLLLYPLRPSDYLSRQQISMSVGGTRMRIQPLVLAGLIISSQVFRVVLAARVLGNLALVSPLGAAKTEIATIFGLVLLGAALFIVLRAPGLLVNSASSSLLVFCRDIPIDRRVVIAARIAATSTMVLTGAMLLLGPLVIVTGIVAKLSIFAIALTLAIFILYVVMLVALQYLVALGIFLPLSQSRAGAKLISGINLFSFIVLVAVLTGSSAFFSASAASLAGLGDRLASWMVPWGLLTTAPWAIGRVLSGSVLGSLAGIAAVALLCGGALWWAVAVGDRALGYIYETPHAASTFRVAGGRLVVDETAFEQKARVKSRNLRRWLDLPHPLLIARYLGVGAESSPPNAPSPVTKLLSAVLFGLVVVAAATMTTLAQSINLPTSPGLTTEIVEALGALMLPGVALAMAGRIRGDGVMLRRFFAPLPVRGAAIAQAYLLQCSVAAGPYLAVAVIGALVVFAKASLGLALALGAVAAMQWVALASIAVTGGLLFPNLDASDSTGARSPGIAVSLITYASSLAIFGGGALLASYVVVTHSATAVLVALSSGALIALAGWLLVSLAGGALTTKLLVEG